MTSFLPNKKTHFQNWKGRKVDMSHDSTNNVTDKRMSVYKGGLSSHQEEIYSHPAWGKSKLWVSTKCMCPLAEEQVHGGFMPWRRIFNTVQNKENTPRVMRLMSLANVSSELLVDFMGNTQMSALKFPRTRSLSQSLDMHHSCAPRCVLSCAPRAERNTLYIPCSCTHWCPLVSNAEK